MEHGGTSLSSYTLGAAARRSEVQGQPQLHNEFEAILGSSWSVSQTKNSDNKIDFLDLISSVDFETF